jgi:ribosome-associated protein
MSTLPEEPSKTQLKQAMTDLQKIGEILVDLPEAQLIQIPLEPRLADAIELARRLTTRESIRRQLQYIGKLMRTVDPEPIKSALAKIQLQNQQGKAIFHQIERWRDQLIAEGDAKVQEFLEQYPIADRQQLRQLIRNAQQNKRGAETELFRFLRQIVEAM